MMRIIIITLLIALAGNTFSQTDSSLVGKWHLIKIIDNMTGSEILPTHKSNPDHVYYIEFDGSNVKFNKEINTCSNSYELPGKREINFKYYDSCTKICCDGDFSKLLTYEQCSNYFIKNNETLILVSEDRIFYFKKQD